ARGAMVARPRPPRARRPKAAPAATRLRSPAPRRARSRPGPGCGSERCAWWRWSSDVPIVPAGGRRDGPRPAQDPGTRTSVTGRNGEALPGSYDAGDIGEIGTGNSHLVLVPLPAFGAVLSRGTGGPALIGSSTHLRRGPTSIVRPSRGLGEVTTCLGDSCCA